jgi:hypothetical protein
VFVFYTISKSVLFGMNKTSRFRMIYTNIKYFIDDYVWCFYTGMLAVVMFCPYLLQPIGRWQYNGINAYSGHYIVTFWDMVWSMVIAGALLNCVIVPVLLLRRCIYGCIDCFQKTTAAKQPSVSISGNKQIARLTDRQIVRYYALKIRDDIFYYSAVAILFLTILCAVIAGCLFSGIIT